MQTSKGPEIAKKYSTRDSKKMKSPEIAKKYTQMKSDLCRLRWVIPAKSPPPWLISRSIVIADTLGRWFRV